MNPPQMPAAKRAAIVKSLKETGNVQETSRITGASWGTVDKIRRAEKMGKFVPTERIPAAKRAEIIAHLKANPDVSDSAAGVDLHVSKNTVARIRKEAELPDPVRKAAARLDASTESRQHVADSKEIARLRAELRKAHETAIDNDAIRELIGNMRDHTPEPPQWLVDVPKRGPGGTPEVPVISLSDWHLGEVVPLSETGGSNEYNPKIAERRVRSVVTAMIHLCKNHGPGVYPGAVLNLIGDFISGGLHPELLKTDAMEQIPSALRAYELLIWAIETLVEEFGLLYIACTAGNHGRQTAKPEFKRYVYKNFDWLIYQLLAKHFANDPRITFDIPDSNEVHYRVWGMNFLLMHGDMMGVKGGDGIIGALGPIARGEVKVSKQASALGKDVDMMVVGHFHQELWLPRITVANCLIGFNEYAAKALRAVSAPPSQPLFFVHPTRGITSRWNVAADPPKVRGADRWLSFEKRDAQAA